MDNICRKCERVIILNATSFGKCEACDKDVYCGHIPCYKLCDECAEKLNRCKQCGEDMDYFQ